jgi:hypothetical protein
MDLFYCPLTWKNRGWQASAIKIAALAAAAALSLFRLCASTKTANFLGHCSAGYRFELWHRKGSTIANQPH